MDDQRSTDVQWREEGELEDDDGPGIFLIRAAVYMHCESAAAAVEVGKAVAEAMTDTMSVAAVRMIVSRESTDDMEGYQA